MSKTTEEIAATKAGSSEESKKFNPAGVYVLKRSDGTEDRIIAQTDSILGTAQADGYVRVGYVFERESTPEDFNPEMIVDMSSDKKSGVSISDFEEMKRQLRELKESKESLSVLKEVTPTYVLPEAVLSKMNLDQLSSYAVSIGGIEVTNEMSKAEITKAILAYKI